jgi:hypothetical protein
MVVRVVRLAEVIECQRVMGTGFDEALAAAPRGNAFTVEAAVVVVERVEGDEQAARTAPAPPAARRPMSSRRPRRCSKSPPASDPEVMNPPFPGGAPGSSPAAGGGRQW